MLPELRWNDVGPPSFGGIGTNAGVDFANISLQTIPAGDFYGSPTATVNCETQSGTDTVPATVTMIAVQYGPDATAPLFSGPESSGMMERSAGSPRGSVGGRNCAKTAGPRRMGCNRRRPRCGSSPRWVGEHRRRRLQRVGGATRGQPGRFSDRLPERRLVLRPRRVHHGRHLDGGRLAAGDDLRGDRGGALERVPVGGAVDT